MPERGCSQAGQEHITFEESDGNYGGYKEASPGEVHALGKGVRGKTRTGKEDRTLIQALKKS